MISSFSRLQFSHSLIPDNFYKLSLNDSLFHTRHISPSDISHVLFDCFSVSFERKSFINLLSSKTLLNSASNLSSKLPFIWLYYIIMLIVFVNSFFSFSLFYFFFIIPSCYVLICCFTFLFLFFYFIL